MYDAIYYNEDKVALGEARCIDAIGFGKEAADLTIREKNNRFKALTEKNKITEVNTLHVSLSFHPGEDISDQLMRDIADDYMQQVGYGDQPYLLYRHTDTGNDHMHIVTTNIQPNGDRIESHRFVEDQSEPARKKIELDYGIVQAEGHHLKNGEHLSRINIEGKDPNNRRQVKRDITNVVREVFNSYKYGSLAEYSAILSHFGVMLDNGKEGSVLNTTGGLLYSIIDETDSKWSMPIKGSKLADKPILKRLEERYDSNRENRKRYRARIIRVIEDSLKTNCSRQEFEKLLEKDNIAIIYRKNENDFTYGVTFVDTLTKVAYNGRDLGKGYSAGALLQRIEAGRNPELHYNQILIADILAGVDYRRRPQTILRYLDKHNIGIEISGTSKGKVFYRLGHRGTSPDAYVNAPSSFNNWLNTADFGAVNNQSETLLEKLLSRTAHDLAESIDQHLYDDSLHYFEKVADDILGYTYTSSYVPGHYKRKKGQKNGPRR
ncbi:relaxase/mobilization nuclease domain-containing protein [Chitinophaga arvensicola]|uniref:Relaxase/Mobilisation nuclease domain-containing protein n=1 Tax=Chitinophaga arvensicola TaxID=29529 RepID=A0A1I0PLZ4_9BACT|nr:relaxase/mobilization nuclease domain-containing protein [Chitinophaga arvensicola]SEW15245.1 Relaxase/Mobilisation nuclease domain-containing protein [Chitinophaga arvensicola]